MAAPSPSKKSTVSKGPSWSDVRDMFAELGLEICDDAARITTEFESRRKKYVIDANKPGQVGETARAHMKNGQTIIKDSSRQTQLSIVFDAITAALRANLETQLSSGLNIVESSVVTAWQQHFGEKMFGCDPKLAKRFVADWMKQDGLEIGHRAVPLPTVSDFQAHVELRRVKLSWKRPGVPFDRIVVTRDGKSEPVYSGGEDSCIDNDTLPGQTYLYRLHAERLQEKGPAVTTKVTCLGDVVSPSINLEKGRIKLDWKMPFSSARVAVFRRLGSRPTLLRGGAGWEATDNSTTQVLPPGNHTAYEEQAVEGNTTYFQIIVTDGLGNWTDGVVLQLSVAKPPPAPAGKLDARYVFDNGHDIVSLNWQAAGASPEFRYVVVRKEGSIAPTHPQDGLSSEALNATSWNDNLSSPLQSGKSYSYTVFTQHNGTFSHSGAASPPVDILSEVTGMDAKVSEDEVKLIWQSPRFVKSVQVIRTPSGDIRVDGTSQAVDSTVTTGSRYSYRIHCDYQIGGRVVRSKGVTMIVEAGGPPEAIRSFSWVTMPHSIEFTWEPPTRGIVRVWRGPKRPSITERETLTLKQRDQKLFDWKAEEIRLGHNRATDDSPSDDMRFYIPFIDSGATCVAGPVRECAFCPGVTNLQFLEVVDRSVVISWNWPNSGKYDCKSALVLVRADTWPQGDADPHARAIVEARSDYDRRGGRFKFDPPSDSPQAYVLVLPMRYAPGGSKVIASPDDPECRIGPILCGPPTSISYKITKGLFDQKSASVDITITNLWPSFSGFKLVAGPSLTSDNAEEQVVFEWQPDRTITSEVRMKEKFDLRFLSGQWRRCSLRLVLRNPAEAEVVKIHHESQSTVFTL